MEKDEEKAEARCETMRLKGEKCVIGRVKEYVEEYCQLE